MAVPFCWKKSPIRVRMHVHVKLKSSFACDSSEVTCGLAVVRPVRGLASKRNFLKVESESRATAACWAALLSNFVELSALRSALSSQKYLVNEHKVHP